MTKFYFTLIFSLAFFALKAQSDTSVVDQEPQLQTIDSETPVPFDQLPQEIVQQIQNSRFVTWEVVQVLWIEKGEDKHYLIELKDGEELKSIKFEKSWKIKREKQP
jgi:hypothetical protein